MDKSPITPQNREELLALLQRSIDEAKQKKQQRMVAEREMFLRMRQREEQQ